jgi:predicted O-methyltransferase YrrM
MSKKVILTIAILTLLIPFYNGFAQPRPGGQPGLGRWRGPEVDNQPLPKNEFEKKILDVLQDMNQNQRRGMMNVSPEDGRVLRLFAESIGAKKVVEIGTSNGYSGIWFCLALKKTGGQLITHEIDERRASLARENFKRAGVDDIITLVMGDAHETVTRIEEPIDILFLDADKSGYRDYLDKLLPLVRPGGLILAHNTTNSGEDMEDYINAVTTDPALDTIFLHQARQGLGVTLKKRHMEMFGVQEYTNATEDQITEDVNKFREPDIHYVPTPQDVVDQMLLLARVTEDDLLYDLGCGDGRIVVTAAKQYGCKAVGYDIDPQRVKESRENVKRNNVEHLVKIEHEDIFTLDLSKADVITLYLLPSLNDKLLPQLEKLKPGSRIVSHDFDITGVKPDMDAEITSEEDGEEHLIYLWTTPLKKE